MIDLDPTGLDVRLMRPFPHKCDYVVVEVGRFYAISLDELITPEKWMAVIRLWWPIPDPRALNTLAAFEEARDTLEGLIFDWLTKFEEQFEPEPVLPPHHLASDPRRSADV